MTEATQKTPEELRNELRANTLGKPTKPQTRIIKHDGQEYQLRQPTIGERMELRNKATMRNAQGVVTDFNVQEFCMWAVIRLCVVPDTDVRVFEDADYDQFRQRLAGDFVDTFTEVVMELLNVDTDAKKDN